MKRGPGNFNIGILVAMIGATPMPKQKDFEEDILDSLFSDNILLPKGVTQCFNISERHISRQEMFDRQLEVLRLIRVKKPDFTPRSPKQSEKLRGRIQGNKRYR